MKIGLIGCGIWGSKILRELLSLGIEVAVVEQGTMQMENLDPNVEISGSTELVTKVDGWVIATPASTHRAVVEELDCLSNTAPIFCEKPLAASVEDAEWFIKREASAPIFVMHIWTFHPGIQKLRELFKEGLIGQLTQIRSTRVNWTSPRTDVDCLSNLGPHDLSIFQYILGDIPKARYAVGESIAGKLVSCLGLLQESSGPKCIFEVSNRYGEKRREVRLHGTEGVLVFNEGDGNFIELIRGEGNILPNEVETFAYPSNSALRSELQVFCRYLATGDARGLPSLKSGIRVINVIDSIRKLIQ